MEDGKGLRIFLKALIQDSPFLLTNLRKVANILKDCNIDLDCQIIIGSDFDTHLDASLDNLGGRIKCKPSVKEIKGMKIANDLSSS